MKKINDFKTVLEFSPDAIIIVSAKGTIEFVNLRAEQLFDYQKKDLLGQGVEILIPERFVVNHKKRIQSYFKVKHFLPMKSGLKLPGKRKDGTEIPITISLIPIEKEGLVAAVMRNISEKSMNDHLMNKAKQLEDFGFTTLHNLRSPVSNLSSLLGFYKTEKTPEGKDILFGKFEQVVDKLSDTINNLVDVLIIQLDKNKVVSKIDFEAVYNDVLVNLEYYIKETKAEINADFSQAPTIEYSKIYLESIIQNLLSNALKYASPDRTSIISIRTYMVENRIQLTVSDNGSGIDLKKYGSDMFGLNKTFHKNTDSKGVGLYITKTQIDAMGGKITIESEVNKGTTFTIIFKI